MSKECSIESWDDLVASFYAQCKIDDLNEILTETRVLKEFKGLYAKHAFDALGAKCRQLYYTQEGYLKLIKDQYKEKYGA